MIKNHTNLIDNMRKKNYYKKTMTSEIFEIRQLLKKHHHECPILFFKTSPGDYSEHDKFLGIRVPNLRKVAKKYYNLSLDDNQILLQSEYNEERLLALIILIAQYQKAEPELKSRIYQYYLNHLTFVNNWNLVDSSAHHIIGAHCFPNSFDPILELVSSNSLWDRRIAIVATFHFIKKRQLNLTYQIAKTYLSDKEDLIHKATGWMLREAGKVNLASLRVFLDQHASYMPRTMLRYAIEKMDINERKHYLKIS